MQKTINIFCAIKWIKYETGLEDYLAVKSLFCSSIRLMMAFSEKYTKSTLLYMVRILFMYYMSEGIFAKALNAMTPLVMKAFSIYCCLNIFAIVCTLLDSLKVLIMKDKLNVGS